MKTQIFKTNGKHESITPANGIDFSLAELQNYVGGSIELVYLNNGSLLVINEEGKLDNLPVNSSATIIAKQNGAICEWDMIVGDAVYCKENQVK